MESISQIAILRSHLQQWRQAGQRIAFVPTMGNLHRGHMDLVDHARQWADRVVVSIFVNPTQFGPNEDYQAYPRTLAQDSQLLAENQVDVLFHPTAVEMYPGGLPARVRIEVPGISELLCGAVRPGHFAGVATVVAKLFNAVQPDLAIFGEKDYQQLLVIRRLTQELLLPIQIVGVLTRRDVDGLAMSSRNQYLTAEERKIAPGLYATLQAVARQLTAGQRGFSALEEAAFKELNKKGFNPDYLAIRRASDLGVPSSDDKDIVILVAAYLGKARLIDNLRISI